ncbi:uncharacterized protein MONBRDRAFT_30792 [Monosiga brevicollis MX1]|uniref:Small ribosomal subunit protein uS2 n=1 Tax=Monosiga brevicollis TaxID=81824 RepID=RSSA_MONBE|nr:uncharacterized protein MONBRDRAFT_30792 [Monosiga brevicollis MX1]A9UPA2.1 RecName: Full=Small ribosomal subunit protein uS2; AltName: Full=40S ribosomal protein SA [Monosiga brevicollis]EDQ92383.1 predicted protein [Monosiga brevicollis MX1]|eukprot:XP_001742145.1 hypothetical protein [Monosiga brevicollis MX1]
MSEGFDILKPTEADIQKLLMAKVHLGASNCTTAMSKYVYKRRSDGVNVIDLNKTYEKIVLAARIIAAVDSPANVCAISGRNFGQRAILKFCNHIGGAFPIAGRFTPGAFTNQIQKAFQEPRLLVLTDPLVDHQAVREASYVNIPIISLCDVDAPLRYVDVVIPCNNKSPHAIGIVWWMLAREVLRLRGTLPRDAEWDVMPDLYFFRDPEEIKKEEEAAAAAKEAEDDTGYTTQWDDAALDADWSATGTGNFAAAPADGNWGATTGGDWAAAGGEEWTN